MNNELTINQIGGLFNQMYNLEETLSEGTIIDGFYNINSHFWFDFFDINNIKNMINKLCQSNDIYSTKLQAIKNNPLIFLNIFNEAINNINSQKLDDKTFFKYIETLQMVCYLHSYLYSSPFELSIFEGYKHDQFSAKQLKKNCELPFYNPYYKFITEKIMPKIDYKTLNILWIKGRPNISAFCIAKKIKEKYPNVKVVSIANNTEFFSFNKIAHLLENNHAFFSVFDCVVLNDSKQTYNEVRNCLNNNINLNEVNNIIYTPDKGKTILCTENSFSGTEDICVSQREIEMNRVINLKLYPGNICYWNKCSFCAINKKYFPKSNDWNSNYAIQQLKKLNALGIKKFWALDEAIPASKLAELCNLMKTEHLDFSWHVRTRIEKNILENDLPQKLHNAGLKHILFGFESASQRILKLMNKTEDTSTYVELAEKIVKVFNDLQIQVHFPLIIGFPTETSSDRNETFRFMNYLKNQYPYFSYNINILNLDVASTLYKKWERYNISKLQYPCEPYSFIGNGVLWENYIKPISIQDLELLSQNQMKKQFDWYPENTLVDINTFFAMWEYSRNQMNTLSDIKNYKSNEDCNFQLEHNYVINSNIVLFQDEESFYCLYNFDNHQCVRGGKLICDIINEIESKSNIREYLEHYDSQMHMTIRNFVLELEKCDFICQT